MKRALFILSLLILSGCGGGGSSSQETKFMGERQDTNYIQQGMQYLAQKNIGEAIKNFDMAIKEDPTNPKNYLVLGEVYIKLKQYPRAVDSLNAATRIAPNDGDVNYLLATAEALRKEDGDLKRAVVHAERSVQIFMQNKEPEKLKRAVTLLEDLTGKKLAPKQI